MGALAHATGVHFTGAKTVQDGSIQLTVQVTIEPGTQPSNFSRGANTRFLTLVPLFLECVIDEMPFPVQRLQADRGTEFTAYKLQDRLLEGAIEFRPVRPASPHLNGKVERAQRTDLDEFYSVLDLSSASNRNIEMLEQKLAEWQHYYNRERIHGSLGKPPIDKWRELMWKTPY